MLQQLGINSTTLIQFIIFVMTFIVLVKFIYEPFTKSMLERQKRTVGSGEIADEISKKANDLQSEYAVKARDIHTHISEIYRNIKSETSLEYDKIINKSKDEAKQLVDENRKKIEAQAVVLKKDLISQTPAIVLAITNKLLGK